MASLQRNVAGQNLTFCLVSTTTGLGVAGATVAISVVKDNGAQAPGGGTVTNSGNGQYNYAPTQAETNAVDVGFFFSATGCIPCNLDFHTDQTDANGLLKVDVEDINGNAQAAVSLQNSANTICYGTCSGGSTTTAVVSSMFNPTALTDIGQLIGRTIIFFGSSTTPDVQAQASNITASTTGATPTLTFTGMTHAPANGDRFAIL